MLDNIELYQKVKSREIQGKSLSSLEISFINVFQKLNIINNENNKKELKMLCDYLANNLK